MLKKIKKYKIAVRPFFALRNLKRKVKLEIDEKEAEERIEKEIARLQPLLSPSSLYETYSRNETPEPLKALWDQAHAKALSLSVVLSTVGSSVESAVETAGQSPDPLAGPIADAVARESLEQSLGFVFKLLGEEAKLEACELTPLTPVPSACYAGLLPLLESHKADVTLSGEGKITPLYSSAGFCFWSPASKNKNAKSR